MIILEEGSEEFLPYVRAEIEPSGTPFRWWFEISVWTPDNALEDGTPMPCWTHYWQRDGSGWGLWSTWNSAREAVQDLWSELFEQQSKKCTCANRYCKHYESDFDKFIKDNK